MFYNWKNIKQALEQVSKITNQSNFPIWSSYKLEASSNIDKSETKKTTPGKYIETNRLMFHRVPNLTTGK